MSEEVGMGAGLPPRFPFTVSVGDASARFEQVSGLDADASARREGGVTLRKGLFANDRGFWDLYNGVKMNTAARRTVAITLLDEHSAPRMTWTLNSARPTKIAGADSVGDQVVVESLEIAYETMTVSEP